MDIEEKDKKDKRLIKHLMSVGHTRDCAVGKIMAGDPCVCKKENNG